MGALMALANCEVLAMAWMRLMRPLRGKRTTDSTESVGGNFIVQGYALKPSSSPLVGFRNRAKP